MSIRFAAVPVLVLPMLSIGLCAGEKRDGSLKSGSLAHFTLPSTADPTLEGRTSSCSGGSQSDVSIGRVFVDGNRISLDGRVSMPSGKGRLEFQFSSASFALGRNVRYAYLLEGFDTEWNEAGDRHAAYYTNIPAGNYRFLVMALGDSQSNCSAAFVDFRLLPHFYQNPFVIGTLALFLVAIVARAQRVRVKLPLADPKVATQSPVESMTRDLQPAERMFRQLAQDMHEMFWVMDPETGRTSYVNPVFTQTGFTKDADESTRNWLSLVHPDDASMFAEIRGRQRRGEKVGCEYRVTANGKTRWIWDRGFPVYDYLGNLERIVGVMEDVTDRKQADHVPCLVDNDFSPMAQLQETHSSSRTLLALIDGVGNSRNFGLNPADPGQPIVNVHECVAAVYREVLPIASEKNLSLYRVVDSNVPGELLGESQSLKKVLRRLLHGAVKCTEKGGISISVSLVRGATSALTLEFSVTDTSAGVSPESQAQLDDCAKLAASMQGAVRIYSEPGEGSCVSFTAQFGLPSACTERVKWLVRTN